MNADTHFNLLALPDDVLLAVFTRVDPFSLAALCLTSRKLNAISSNPSLWRELACARWAVPQTSSFATPVPAPATTLGPAGPGPAEPAQETRRRAPSRAPRPISDRGFLPTGKHGESVAWKALFAGGNGWEPPRLRHLLLQPAGDYISAMQPFRMPLQNHTESRDPMAPGPGTRASYAAAASGAAPGGSSSSGVSSGSSRVAAAASGEQLLLALADSYELQVWRVPAVAAPGAGVGLQDRPQPQAGPQLAAPQPGRGQGSREPAPAPQAAAEGRESEAEGGALSQHQQHQRTLQPLVRAAAYPLPRHALIYSLAWIPAAAASTIGDGAAAAAACGAGAAAIAVADGGRGRGTGAGAAADGAGGSPQGEAHPVILAAGTHQGAIEWYAYEGGVTEGGNSSAGAAPVASTAASATGSAAVASASASAAGDSSSCRSDSLRLLKTTTCGSTQPLVDLHFLPPAAPSASQSPESLHSSAAGGRKSGRGAAATDGGAQFSAAAGLWGDAAAAGGSSSSSSMTVGRRGVLVGLQDASFALAGVGGVRNTIQLFDVGTMTHLASVVDP